MHRAVRFEEVWETTIAQAREKLLEVDARSLYLDFFNDLVQQINAGVPKAAKFVTMLEQVFVRGLGMTREAVTIERAQKGGTACKVRSQKRLVEKHIQDHVLGEHFL